MYYWRNGWPGAGSGLDRLSRIIQQFYNYKRNFDNILAYWDMCAKDFFFFLIEDNEWKKNPRYFCTLSENNVRCTFSCKIVCSEVFFFVPCFFSFCLHWAPTSTIIFVVLDLTHLSGFPLDLEKWGYTWKTWKYHGILKNLINIMEKWYETWKNLVATKNSPLIPLKQIKIH